MLCLNCGKEVAQTDARCGSCGSSLSPDKPPSGKSLPNASANPSPWTPEPSQRSGKATASLILGLIPFVLTAAVWWVDVNFPNRRFLDFHDDFAIAIALLFGFVSVLLVAPLLAVIFGHWAKSLIRRSGEELLGRGTANAGLVLGYLGLAVFLLLLIIPNLMRSRITGDGPSPVGSLRTINTAATVFSETYGHGFPPMLAALGCKPGEPNEKAAGLIDEILASGAKAGYRFTYVPGKADETGKIQTYTVHADPINPKASGNMHYFTDQTGVIRQQNKKEADEHSPAIAG